VSRLMIVLLSLVGLAIVIQLVPYGRDHENPPVKAEPAWATPETREIFFRACKDCHSNETEWPWYSHVAPFSWLLAHDVAEGREHFNVSEWGRPGKNDGDEAAEEVEEGEMPLPPYLITHPEAKLEGAELERFVAGLKATFPESGEGHGDEHDH